MTTGCALREAANSNYFFYQHFCVLVERGWQTYEGRVLIRLQHYVQHFPAILTRLINKALSYGQKPWKGSFHNLIKVGSVFP
jgi:hypothetical protein